MGVVECACATAVELGHEFGKVGTENLIESCHHFAIAIARQLSSYASSLLLQPMLAVLFEGIHGFAENFLVYWLCSTGTAALVQIALDCFPAFCSNVRTFIMLQCKIYKKEREINQSSEHKKATGRVREIP